MGRRRPPGPDVRPGGRGAPNPGADVPASRPQRTSGRGNPSPSGRGRRKPSRSPGATDRRFEKASRRGQGRAMVGTSVAVPAPLQRCTDGARHDRGPAGLALALRPVGWCGAPGAPLLVETHVPASGTRRPGPRFLTRRHRRTMSPDLRGRHLLGLEGLVGVEPVTDALVDPVGKTPGHRIAHGRSRTRPGSRRGKQPLAAGLVVETPEEGGLSARGIARYQAPPHVHGVKDEGLDQGPAGAER